MNLVKLSVRDSINELTSKIAKNEDIVIFVYADEKVIGHGIYEDLFDKQYCIDNNIAMLNANFPGGACVVFEGDINFLAYEHGHSELGKKITQKVNEFLHTKNINSEIIGNDIVIIENDIYYKVGSYASAWMNNDEGTETVMHISMSVDNDLIDIICKKFREKQPKGLNDYGITAKEIIDYLNENMEEFEGKLKF